jgi:uncharacterized protein YvpB
MKKILDIPHTCMHNDSIPEEWHIRVCGLACVKMILDYRNIEVSLLDLLNEGQCIGAYNSSIGWDHNGLVRLLRNHGVLAYPQEFRSVKVNLESGEMTDSTSNSNFLLKGILKIKESIDMDNPVIVSVKEGFGDNKSPHIILVVGYDDDNIYFNDPNNSNGEIKKAHPMTKERFLKYWRQFVIFTD